MTLTEWDHQVAPSLHRIESYSRAVERAARELPARPAFPDAKAEVALDDAAKVLEAALRNIHAAREEYARKPLEAA